MTNHPQQPEDEEISRVLSHIMNAAKSHYTGKSPCLSPGDVKMVESLPSLIKADREASRLEARLDELSHFDDDQAWVSGEGVQLVKHRIATLTKELNKLKKETR